MNKQELLNELRDLEFNDQQNIDFESDDIINKLIT